MTSASRESKTSPRRAGTRQYISALACIGGGALVGWWACASTWMVVESSLLGAGEIEGVQALARESVQGSSLIPLGAAMPVVGLAGLAGIVGSRRWLRRAIGAVIALSGLALTWSAVDAFAGFGVGEAGPGGGVVVSVAPAYPMVAAIAGAMLAVGGAWTILRGQTWPSLGVNYERAVDRPRSAWEALDRGIDPSDFESSNVESSEFEAGDGPRRTERPGPS